MSRRTLLAIAAVLVIAGLACAGEITVHHTAAPPELKKQADGFDHFTRAPGPVYGPAGSPELPHLEHRLLLPPGEEIQSVEIQNPVWTPLPGYYLLYPAQPPVPISQVDQPPFTSPDPAVYASPAFYPADPVEMSRTDFLCGHGLGSISLYAVRYHPATGRLEALTSYDLSVRTRSTPRAGLSRSKLLKQTPRVLERLSRQVENPAAASAYGVLDETDDLSCHYLIITTAALQPTFMQLAQYRISHGLGARIKLVEDIAAHYPGGDLQEKIRNCIIDFYTDNRLEYVLLGGDTDLVPKRGFYAAMGSTVDDDVPCDLYYCNLDGDWNANRNNLYGEPEDNPDLYSELAIGRMCAGNATQAANLISKTIAYESSPVASELPRGLMVGEDLGWYTWGSQIKNEVLFGSDNWGYTTVGFPPNFQVDSLYETPTFHFDAMTDLLPLLNGGQHLINHMGHGNNDWVMKFLGSQITDQNCTNNGVNHNFYFAYSQACYSGAYDNRNSNLQYVGDCICENFTTIAHGAVGFVANARFGWGSYSSTNGPSQYYDREFFDALFGENVYHMGWINADSKEDNIPRLFSASYWCFYETNLLGDPALEIWTAQPLAFAPAYSPLHSVGTTQFSVNVGTAGAVVTLSAPGGVVGSGFSNAQGMATVVIQNPITAPGDFPLCITKHNYIPYQGIVHFTDKTIPEPLYPGPTSLGGGETTSPIPSQTALGRVYPNPFNPATAISYKLQAASQVRLTVWDTAGKLVNKLADTWQAAGIHEVIFDGSRLPSGLYFVRMQAGDYCSVQKLVLLK